MKNAVVMWIKEVRNRNIPLSGPIIAAKATDFASQMGISLMPIWLAKSEGWLSRFRTHHRLTFRNGCDEAAEVDHADKSALYFKLLTNKTLTCKGDACAGGKE